MKQLVLGVVVAIGVLVIGGGSWLASRFFLDGPTPAKVEAKQDTFTPPLADDVSGRTVAVADPSTPGGLAGWHFQPGDRAVLNQLDFRRDEDDARRVVYADVAAKSADGQVLSGIIEVHYVRVAKAYYPVALGSVSLKLVKPPKLDKKDPPKGKDPVTPGQVVPGKG